MMKIALIVDNHRITRWQESALLEALKISTVQSVFSCSNTELRRNILTHWAYYALNLLSLRNEETRLIKIHFPGVDAVDFHSIWEGKWQALPSRVVNRLVTSRPDVIVKFGMSLLRLDDRLEGIPILSFHHGDPAKFRGRPAGFYEILQGEPRVGIIVQEISNVLDGGIVRSRGYSKVSPHSYRETALSFFRQSRYLLRRALQNLSEGVEFQVSALGNIYRLPTNRTVVAFVAKLLRYKLDRLTRGLFYEKAWRFSYLKSDSISSLSGMNPEAAREIEVVIPAGYRFAADPFLGSSGKVVRAELLNSFSGLGEIHEFDAEGLTWKRRLFAGGHFSYPFSFHHNGKELLIPEVASHSQPVSFSSCGGELVPTPLVGLESIRLVDGTFFRHDNRIYCFGNDKRNESGALLLFVSEPFQLEFREHPSSPILVSPRGGRMAGPILVEGNKMMRLGQENSASYGAGTIAFEIMELSAESYEEEELFEISFANSRGPHTISSTPSGFLVDFYEERLAPFQWARKLLATGNSLLPK